MNRNEAAKLVAILSAAYPQAQTRPEMAAAYFMALSDVPYPAAERAVAVLMRTSKFLPTAAEIREVLTDAVTGIEPWEAAWDELMQTVKQYGSYLHMPRNAESWGGWSDDLVEMAVRHVGYENVCGADQEDLPTIRAQFRNAYQTEAGRRKKIVQTGDAALSLPGASRRPISAKAGAA